MLFGSWQDLFRTVASCIAPEMADRPNYALASVLDDMDQPSANGDAAHTATANGHSSEAQLQDAVQEEHVARVKAEGEAEDFSRRLTVAQEQIAEYALERHSEVAKLLEQADNLQASLHKVDGESSSNEGLSTVGQRAEALSVTLRQIVREAHAFAAQQKADAERTKRSFSQAKLASDGTGDVEMKRMREGSTSDSGSAHEEQSSVEWEAVVLQGSERDAAQPDGMADVQATPSVSDFTERARYIPLRLNQQERRLLRLLEAALAVSEYTDKVDILAWSRKSTRIHAQLKDICAILSGLVVAQDYKRGQQLLVDRNFSDNATFFQDCFEVGRRYKVMNPDRMRSDYGKLMYLLMDASEPDIQDLLEFNCVRPLRTVHALLEYAGGLALLQDPLLSTATAEIVAGSRPRMAIQRDIKAKERARDGLARKYRSARLTEEDIQLCIVSMADNNTFLAFNRDPVDAMITHLQQHFSPDQPEAGASLAISGGLGGARLTHSHQRQYSYVLQSLTLWREIMHDMFRLWCLAEGDLLHDKLGYRLVNTGQGLNRVQQAPGIGKAMRAILHKCQQRVPSWVGSSVVHLGDHNVPNALMFIDKYTQVPRILNPVVLVLEAIPKLCQDEHLSAYVHKVFGGVEECRHAILLDFFRHAFDGSGADNFFDAGSCIDGRLTSAWNWGSKVEKKAYYPVFLLAGFAGFDGEFNK